MTMLISSPVEVYRKLLLFTIAILFGVLELWIPRIPLFPWLKPGLANVVTMVWLLRYGVRDTLLFGMLRIWITAFFFGFSFFTVVPAISGLIASVAGVAILVKINRFAPTFGWLGFGVTGAFFHNMGQLASLKLLIAEASLWQLQFPVMIGAALITGTITSFLAWRLDSLDLGNGGVLFSELPVHELSLWKKVASLLLLMVMIAVLWLQSPLQGIVFLAVCLLLVLIATRSWRNCVAPFQRSWLFLLTLFLAARWGTGSWDESLLHLCRLSGWILCAEIFRKLESDRLIFHGLYHLFPAYESTFAAALLTVELFPELMKNSAIKIALRPQLFLRSPSAYLVSIVEMSHTIIEEGGWGVRKK